MVSAHHSFSLALIKFFALLHAFLILCSIAHSGKLIMASYKVPSILGEVFIQRWQNLLHFHYGLHFAWDNWTFRKLSLTRQMVHSLSSGPRLEAYARELFSIFCLKEFRVGPCWHISRFGNKATVQLAFFATTIVVHST